MTGTLIGVGLLWNGCSSADKGQVSSPSAALMGRANSDPSPVEHQLGQSIVSNRVPAFRVTSPSLPLAGGAAGSFSSMRPERISSQKEAIMLSKHDTQNYIMIISPLWFINSLIQIPPQSKMHACSLIEACSEHGKQHCSNIVQYH